MDPYLVLMSFGVACLWFAWWLYREWFGRKDKNGH